MSKEKDPNKKHYFKPALYEEFVECIEMHCASKDLPPLTLWERGNSEDEAEPFVALGYSYQTRTIKLKLVGKLVAKLVGSANIGRQVLIKIPASDKVHYFTGGKLSFYPEDLSYSLEIEQEIYKSQARKNFRLNTGPGIQVQFKVDDQVFEALDISVGGTSFYIEAHDSSRFAKGKIFYECTLRFDRKNYYIPSVQVAVLEPATDGTRQAGELFKVGLSFRELPKKTVEELYIKITTEARGEEMKNKFNSILSKKTG